MSSVARNFAVFSLGNDSMSVSFCSISHSFALSGIFSLSIIDSVSVDFVNPMI